MRITEKLCAIQSDINQALNTKNRVECNLLLTQAIKDLNEVIEQEHKQERIE